jgi:hypothetical protein
MEVTVKPNFTPAGTLYASAADNATLLAPGVAVTPNSDGTYTLAMATLPAVESGNYSGEFTIKLCSDEACTTPQAVPSVKVPYALAVSAAGAAWPGDKPTPLAPWTDVPDWTGFQGNAGHTGYVPVTLNADQFALRWKIGSVNPQRTSTVQTSPATLSATGGLFYTARDNKLQARRETDGSVAWTYDFSTLAYPAVNPTTVEGGVVYMAAGQQPGYLFGLDAVTGGVRIKAPVNFQNDAIAPVAFNGTVYSDTGTYSGVQAISANGDILYRAGSGQGISGTPAVDDASLYVYANNSLYVYDRKTGVQRSRIDEVGGQTSYGAIGGAPVLGAKGTVFAASYSAASWGGANALLKFNVEKGYIDWRMSGAYAVTPAYADGIVYAVNKSPYRLEARAESDGALRWSWTPPVAGETLWNAEPIVTKNMVFVSTDMNTYAIDLRTHRPVWSYPLSGRLALTRSGILYIHANEALVAVSVK